MRKFLAVLPAIVFLFASCDIDPMDIDIDIEIENGVTAPISDPVTVSFYVGEELFHSVIIERGSGLTIPDYRPAKDAQMFLHWTRTTQGGEERIYRRGHWLAGVPFDVSFNAAFRDASYQHEVSDVSHSVVLWGGCDSQDLI